MRYIAIIATAAAIVAMPLRAQAPAFAPGQVTQRVAARLDSTQTYALYLPSRYTAQKTWPVLVVMDPRGRAAFALELFREAAERHGWMVFSSYRTLSDADSAADVNDRALTAILDEAGRLRGDPRRLYLAGFSGTARQGWSFAYDLRESMAGLIGVGGGMPGPSALWPALLKDASFAFFGAAGDVDFNENEIYAADTLLDRTTLPHRVTYFRGAHSWFPKEMAAEAVDWMQLQAMKSGLAERDERWIDSLFAARLAAARALERRGEPAKAYHELRSITADFGELRDVQDVEDAVARLGRDRRVRRAMEHRRAAEQRVTEYKPVVQAHVRALRERQPIIPDGESLSRLRIPALLRQAADSTDAEGARAAGAMLETAYSMFAYYEARFHLDGGDPARALAALRIARAIKPRNPQLCYAFAVAQAQAGDADAALGELRCAADGGVLTPAILEREKLLDPLRSDPRFRELLERVRTAPTAPQPRD